MAFMNFHDARPDARQLLLDDLVPASVQARWMEIPGFTTRRARWTAEKQLKKASPKNLCRYTLMRPDLIKSVARMATPSDGHHSAKLQEMLEQARLADGWHSPCVIETSSRVNVGWICASRGKRDWH